MPPATVNDQANTAIAKREDQQQQAVVSLTDLVQKRAAEIYNDERAKEFTGALTAAAEKNSKLKQCSTSSILASMVACVQLDLIPNTVQGLAYLIPYKNEVQFQLGYKGLVELCYRSGDVLSINAELVFPEDEFDFSFGTNREIKHKPDMTRDRTNLDDATQVYATAQLKNGGTVFDVMSMSEINKIRKFVKAKSTDAPWVTWPEQMAKKTAVKRLTKYLPQSKIDKRLAMAVHYDDLAQAGRLKYKDGELVEGESNTTSVSEPQDQPKKQLQSFAKPPVETVPEEDQVTIIDQSPYPDEVLRPANEYIKEIKEFVEFLKISKREEMRIVNEHAHTPLLEKAEQRALRDIHSELKEMADAKTQLLAEKTP